MSLRDDLDRTIRLLDGKIERNLRDIGLTPTQITVLGCVQSTPECSQTTVVESVGIDRSTVADICHRLWKKGMIERKRCKDDGRRYRMSITQQGEAKLDVAKSVVSSFERSLPTEAKAIAAALPSIQAFLSHDVS